MEKHEQSVLKWSGVAATENALRKNPKNLLQLLHPHLIQVKGKLLMMFIIMKPLDFLPKYNLKILFDYSNVLITIFLLSRRRKIFRKFPRRVRELSSLRELLKFV